MLVALYAAGPSFVWSGLCTGMCASSTQAEAWTVLSLLMVLASVGGYFGPRFVYLGGALFAAVTFLLVLGQRSSEGSAFFLVTMVLTGVAVALDLVAARQTSTFSEQGNPMNLPVFG